MKKLSILFLSFVTLATIVTSCNDDDNNNSTPAPTVLELIIKDQAGTVVPNAVVKLYPTLDDLNAGTNQVGTTQNSDTAGKVKFSNLSNIAYFFDIQAGCKTNLVGGTYTTNAALVANKTTTMDATILDTSLVTFVNNSTTNAWIVTVGTDVLYIIAKAGATPTSLDLPMPAGNYKITMKELEPDAQTVADLTGLTKDADETLACGGTATVTVP